ncbi:MAG TPA: peptidoglycan DD-metalloendopeptidase family protein [Thermoanaerobaculia bacterium]|nr:peptidoglycan DD-metalloendopeptidase family protein [Thermoanaerobaculia bacterium]
MPLPAETEAPPPVEPPAAGLGVEERRRELAALRRRLADLRARYDATKRKEADLKEAYAAAELNLQIQTAERRVLELRRADAEREAARAKAELEASAAAVGTLRSDLAVRLAALYRLGRLGYFRPIVSADSGAAFLDGIKVLAHLARRDASLLSRYTEAIATLASRETELTERRRELSALAAEGRKRERELAAARTEQAALLARVRKSSEEEKSAVSTLEDKSQRLASLLDLLESHGRTLPPGAASIRKYKGALDWPVKGAVALPFGRIANPKFPNTFLRSSGWTIDAPSGSTIRAIFAGDVAYAQWLKGYGNLVVLDHGDGVFSLYGRLAPSTLARGQRVALGDAVGVLAESPADDEIAGLYFEIRDSRSSVDPANWLR